MVPHWNLSDSKALQVSRTLLSIFANLDNALVWIVSICSIISKSSNLFIHLLKIVPSAPITTVITITFMFHIFLSSLARSGYLSLFSLTLNFTLWSSGTIKSTIQQVLCFFFFLTITWSSLLANIW